MANRRSAQHQRDGFSDTNGNHPLMHNLVFAIPQGEGMGNPYSVGYQAAQWTIHDNSNWTRIGFVNGDLASAIFFGGTAGTAGVNALTTNKQGLFDLNGVTEMSVACWVYPTGWPTSVVRIACDDPGSARIQWALSGLNTGAAQFYCGNAFGAGQAGVNSPAGTMPLNKWTHVCGTLDKLKNIVIYINGIQAAASATPDFIGGSQACPICIGATGANGNNRFLGYILMPCVWRQRCLQPAEVRQLVEEPFWVSRPKRYTFPGVTGSGFASALTLGAKPGFGPIAHLVTLNEVVALPIAAGLSLVETTTGTTQRLTLAVAGGVNLTSKYAAGATLVIGVAPGIMPLSLRAASAQVTLGAMAGQVELFGGRPDVEIKWVYGKWPNTSYKQLVQGVNDESKTPTFVGYQVRVFSGSSPSSLTFRRADMVTTEQYTYSAATNASDAGGTYQRYLQFRVRTYETTGFYSLPDTINVKVVS